MENYKIGNKSNIIIRTYIAQPHLNMEYDNQPYTVLKDKELYINFKNEEKDISTQKTRYLKYWTSKVDSINIRDVELNSKILNLIYSNLKENLISKAENYDSDDEGKIFLNTTAETLYQVFIYNDEGELESAKGSYEGSVLEVNQPNKNYFIVYSYISENEKAFDLNNHQSVLLTLDIETIGNETNKTNRTFLHIEKCLLEIDKQMYFKQNVNTVNLVFRVEENSNDYIIFEK